MSDSLVIIPTYNEKENIRSIIKEVFSLNEPFDILIVDDSSPDGTADIVRELQKEYEGRLFLKVRNEKSGLGAAYIAGFKKALELGHDLIFEMDADFSHDPNSLYDLKKACANEGAHVSVGSRYVKGGKVLNWPWNRILMSYLASLYVRIVLGIHVRDTTAGFKCYKKEVLNSLDLDNVQFVGYAFQIEMKYKAWKKGFKVVEVPITFVDRKYGVSKMDIGIFKEAFWGVLKMRFS